MSKIFTLFFLSLNVRAQQGLNISDGGNIYLAAGATLTFDSLILQPSSSFTLGTATVTRDSNLVHLNSNISIKRVYHFLPAINAFTGNITFFYSDAELNGLTENSLLLNINDGTNWTAYTSSVTRDPNKNKITTAGLSNITLQELTLSGTASALPVKFSFINSQCLPNGIKISWQTEQQFNSKNFEVEKSSDGINWQTIARINSAASGTESKAYSIVDVNGEDKNLYRIVEFNTNGQKSLSPIVKASCSRSESFKVYPNPVKDVVYVHVFVNSPVTTDIKICDRKGVIVKSISKNIMGGINEFEINISHLSKGIYTLSVEWGTIRKVLNLLKE